MKAPCALFLCVSLIAGCGGAGATSHLVGAQCRTDRDCANLCTADSDFGSGMCTQPCASDRDCPGGAVCVKNAGGICAVSCAVTNDCGAFGRAFVCSTEPRPSGGDALVCRLP